MHITRKHVALSGLLLLLLTGWLLRSTDKAVIDRVETGTVGEFTPSQPTPDLNTTPHPVVRGAERNTIRISARLGERPAANGEVVIADWPIGTLEQGAVSDEFLADYCRIRRRETLDAQGHLDLESEPLPFLLGVRVDGSQPFGTSVNSDQREIAITLEPDSPTQVLVKDELGNGIPDATVTGGEDPTISRLFDPGATLARRAVRSFFSTTTKTDSLGRAEVRGMGRGAAGIHAHAPGFGSAAVSAFALPCDGVIELILGPGVRVDGVVLSAETGLPISNARAYIDRYRGEQNLGSSDSSYSNDAGALSIVATSGYQANFMIVRAEGYATGVAGLGALHSGEPRSIVVKLSRSFNLAGRVVDTSHRPIPNAGVWIADPELMLGIDYQATDSDGKFSSKVVSDLRPFRLLSTAAGFDLFEADFFPPVPESVEIVLHSLSTIRGRVRSSDGAISAGVIRLASERDASTRTSTFRGEIDPASGEFEIAGVAPGDYFLDALVDGHAPKRIKSLTVAEGAICEVDIEVEKGLTVRGVVRDKERRTPVIGARLQLIDPSANSTDAIHAYDRTTETDAQGRYEFENVPRGDRTGYFVEADGYARATSQFEVDQLSSSLRRDIELSRPVSVRVRVRRPDSAYATSFRVKYTAQDGGAREIDCTAGVIELKDVPSGTLRIVGIILDRDNVDFFGLQRNLDVEIDSTTKEFLIDFYSGALVVGTLEAPPSMLAGRSFSLSARWLGSGPLQKIVNGSRTPDGRYHLAGLAPGRWLLRMSSTNFGSNLGAERELVVEDGKTYELDFNVGAASVAGFVKDAQGKPIAGASVAMRLRADVAARENGQLVDTWHRDITKPDGSYRVEGLFPGTQEFEVNARGFGRIEGEITEVELDEPNARDFVLESDCTVRVAVRDLAGSVIDHAKIELRRNGSTSAPFVPSEIDSRDRSIVHGASTGPHTLFVRADGFFPYESAVSCVAGEDITVTASLRRPAHLAIQVKDTQGNLLRNTSVEIDDSITLRSIATWLESGLITTSTDALATDDHGELRISGVPEGDYEIRCLGSVAKLSTVPPESPTEVVLVTRN